MVDHLERHNANVARAMHQLGAESSEAFEDARDKIAAFINAPSRDEVIFTKNASEALNLVANRSEEHTSELQSLMRISYDVLCLKKKNIIKKYIKKSSIY